MVALIEADRAYGAVVTNMAVEKAKNVGIGWVHIRNHTHQGTIGQYLLEIANRDMAGLMFASNRPNMVQFGARAAGISNNPVGLSAPASRHPHLVLDMATRVVSMGKILLKRERGEKLQLGAGVSTIAEILPSTRATLRLCCQSVGQKGPACRSCSSVWQASW
ncbi:MAG: Ldh family oxidoreductase [Dehalococcoidia bacterium]|nr:Ldh family oxidoreductase [Dehalococcoidia bacterium]